MSITSRFTRDDVPQWESGLIRWCILEVFFCTAAIVAVNALEFHQKKQIISGYPKGSTQTDETTRSGAYTDNKKEDPNKEGDDKKTIEVDRKKDEKKDVDIKPQTAAPTIGLTVTGLDDVNDYDFIHQLWLYLLIHVVCLGGCFHENGASGMIAVWGYLHALTFGAYMFTHVSLNLMI